MVVSCSRIWNGVNDILWWYQDLWLLEMFSGCSSLTSSYSSKLGPCKAQCITLTLIKLVPIPPARIHRAQEPLD